MKNIIVHASKEYAVKIDAGLLATLGSETAALITGRTSVIVSDSNVWPIYGQIAEKSLESAGFSVFHFVFSPGENSKNSETYLLLLSFLAENHLTRADCLIALGGGVVGDLTGFTAATYLRGIAYVQVPTTLLAMVDSSVGGKTAIDLPAGKNLVGAFYQPSVVLCDTDTLSTLPPHVFTDGCAEIIKYGILFDEALFSHLERKCTALDRAQTIARCVELKRDCVTQDEFDRGARQLLNFGHTIGHAIEKASQYTISHGSAVAIGMCLIARASAANGLCDKSLSQRLSKLLKRFDLPTSTEFSSEELVSYLLSDKKRCGHEITMVIPATIGCCHLKKIPISQVETFIKAGM